MGNDAIVDRLMKPEATSILVGLPASELDFHNTRCMSGFYASSFPGGWAQYEFTFLRPLNILLDLASRIGIHVESKAGLPQFETAFSRPTTNQRDLRLVMILSHWHEQCVEFQGGLVRVDQLVRAIPEEFEGVLDLCVCHPLALVQAVLKCRQSCLVRQSEKRLKPYVWFEYYKVFFQLGKQGDRTYAELLQEVSHAMRSI